MPHDPVCERDAMEELPYLHLPDTEPVPGYRLIEPLGQGGFGEVWKCEAPGGLLKAIKFVRGNDTLEASAPAEEELRAIQHVKSIRHPFILSMERVEVVADELVIVFELADRSLADLLGAERLAGRPGIAREALLAYLREAAEALDVMHVRHGLQHLDVKPQNLFLVSNHVKVGDFGLVQSVSGTTAGLALGAITPLYASPEVFQGKISPHADQYSLAIVYQELLTSTLPFDGRNSRQLLVQHLQAEPNLLTLPEPDRAILARALAKDPAARFPSCTDFVQALIAGQADVSATVVTEPLERPAFHEDDTRRTPTVKTVRTRSLSTGGSRCVARPVAPPRLDGTDLEIVNLVSRTPLTEVWNARAADGSPRLVKVLFGCGAPREAITRLAGLRHPALLPIDVLDQTPGRLVLATAPGERTLRDALADWQVHGQAGIPRARLLHDLREVAETLHTLAAQHGVQHLALNPRTLVLNGDRLLLADFGLAQLFWLPAGQSAASFNPRYSAPELHQRQVSPACDQYSLALIYHELLTGFLPASLPARKGDSGCFGLDRLPVGDRVLVARALHPDPRKRWDSPVELIRALQQLSCDEGTEPARRAPREAPAGNMLRMRFGTSLPADVIRQRLDAFRAQWSAAVLGGDDRTLKLLLQNPRNFWQRWTGQAVGLEVHLGLGEPEVNAPAGVQVRSDVRMDVCPRAASAEQARELLEGLGPLLVESVRQHLSVNPRGRQHDRLAWHYPLQVCPLGPDGEPGPPIECQGKDISLTGIGFYLPGELPSAEVLLHLPQTPQTPRASLRARVVRVQGCGDGWYEVGAMLLPPGVEEAVATQQASGAA
jgi:serine/threonine protein kinase